MHAWCVYCTINLETLLQMLYIDDAFKNTHKITLLTSTTN